jgi:hypothetical protein
LKRENRRKYSNCGQKEYRSAGGAEGRKYG